MLTREQAEDIIRTRGLATPQETVDALVVAGMELAPSGPQADQPGTFRHYPGQPGQRYVKIKWNGWVHPTASDADPYVYSDDEMRNMPLVSPPQPYPSIRLEG